MSGARRIIAQSVAFAYAPGGEPHDESALLDPAPSRRALIDGIVALEKSIAGTHSLQGLILRYGYFYGPGTWDMVPSRKPPISVDAAAHAALLAVTRGPPGIYNVAEDDAAVSIEKARRELGFDPKFRIE